MYVNEPSPPASVTENKPVMSVLLIVKSIAPALNDNALVPNVPELDAENKPVMSASERSDAISPVALSYVKIVISPSLATENRDNRFADVTFVYVKVPPEYDKSPKPVPVVAAAKCACVSAADGPVYVNAPVPES